MQDRVLYTSVAPIDQLVGGFRAGEVTLFDSDSEYVSCLMHKLCVLTVAEFDEEVVWVDGGNAVEPYTLSALCKRLRLDKRDVLSRVNISRAFTAYQLVALIEDQLELEVDRSSAGTVIISSITDLFLDKDMKWMEAFQLLKACSARIAQVTRDHETISLVNARTPGRIRADQRMTRHLYEAADRVVQVREKRGGLMFNLPREGRSSMFLPAPWNQATLDDYRRDIHGTDGTDI